MRQIGADLRHLLLAAVPAERLFRLRTLDPDRFGWESVATWPEAVDAIRGKPVDMAVVDPLLGGCGPNSHGIERLRQFFPSLPLLVYTELAPSTASVLLELGRAGIRRVIVHRFEDAPSSLRLALLAELEHSASQQVIQALTDILRELPSELRQALEAMLHAPGDGPSVTALADRAQLTRRTCERLFTKVGLPSPRVVMVLTRLLYAHRLLTRSRLYCRGRGAQARVQQGEDAADASAGVFGLTAGELRVSLFHEALACGDEPILYSVSSGRIVRPRVYS